MAHYGLLEAHGDAEAAKRDTHEDEEHVGVHLRFAAGGKRLALGLQAFLELARRLDEHEGWEAIDKGSAQGRTCAHTWRGEENTRGRATKAGGG